MKPLLLILSIALLPVPAHAYLDPGTGSVILQGLIAGLMAVTMFFASLRARVYAWYARAKQLFSKSKE